MSEVAHSPSSSPPLIELDNQFYRDVIRLGMERYRFTFGTVVAKQVSLGRVNPAATNLKPEIYNGLEDMILVGSLEPSVIDGTRYYTITTEAYEDQVHLAKLKRLPTPARPKIRPPRLKKIRY